MIDYETYRAGQADDILVVVVSGHLDNETSSFFFDCVQGHIEDGNKRLIVDCNDVEFISSLGLGMLVRAHSRMKKVGGDVKLANIQGLVADVLNRVGMDRLLHLYPSVPDAVASFQGSS